MPNGYYFLRGVHISTALSTHLLGSYYSIYQIMQSFQMLTLTARTLIFLSPRCCIRSELSTSLWFSSPFLWPTDSVSSSWPPSLDSQGPSCCTSYTTVLVLPTDRFQLSLSFYGQLSTSYPLLSLSCIYAHTAHGISRYRSSSIQLQTTSPLQWSSSSSGWTIPQFPTARSIVEYFKNIAASDTVHIGHLSSFQFFKLIEMKCHREKGEFSEVHSFHDLQEKKSLKRNTGLSAGNSASLLMLLMPLSNQFLDKVEFDRRSSIESVNLECAWSSVHWRCPRGNRRRSIVLCLRLEARMTMPTHQMIPWNADEHVHWLGLLLAISLGLLGMNYFILHLRSILIWHDVWNTNDGKKMHPSFTTVLIR